MLVAISSIIISIATGITLFVQTITLSSCRRLECCLGSCHLDTAVSSAGTPNTVYTPSPKTTQSRAS